MSIIKVDGLYKSYGDIKALKGLDLSVEEGEIYGFLGPNGAGKTTAIKVMMGLIKPDKGEIRVNGMDVTEEDIRVRKKLGYLPENVSFYRGMSVEENLAFYCDLKGCSHEVIDVLLEEFDLASDKGKKASQLSKGMTQRLGLAQTLIGDPDVLILDEPTSGLDPEIRRWVKDKIMELRESGKTVLLSSHVLSEVQELCDKVGVISEGKMLAQDPMEILGERLDLDHRVIFELSDRKRALEEVKKLDNVERPRIEEGKLVVYCSGGNKMEVIKYLLEKGFEVTNFSVKEPDLEEVFVKLMEGSR
ncbi:MAG: ATP-binding cassette domain-containing protein [Thermoplasmatota archaeon]